MDEGPASPTMADALRREEDAGKKQAAPLAPAQIGGNAKAPAPPPPAPASVPPKAQAPGVVAETVEVSPAVPPTKTEGKSVDLPVSGVAGGAAEDHKHIAAMNKAKSAPQPQAAPQLQSDTNAMMGSQGLNRAIVQTSQLASGVILTPDHKVWWKIGANGVVELTADAGKNWRTLKTGATAQLTAGFAPSGKVCWIAGQGGTLLLTTDRGGHWKSLATPISGDLGGVHALDAKQATIWDASNRLSYETGDGGATWKQVANE